VLTIVVAVFLTNQSAGRTALYTARTKLYIGANSFPVGQQFDPALSNDQQIGVARLIYTFSIMIPSDSIATAALDRTGLSLSASGVVSRTTAAAIPNTNLIQISVTDTDPVVAQTLANGVSDAFVAKISDLEPGQSLGVGDLPRVPARIFERAKLPVVPQKADTLSSLFVAGLLAFLVASGIVLLVEYLDITVKSADDAERRFELPVLAVVPVLKLDPSATVVVAPATRRDDLGLVRDG
jgi:capsular polysaccharide biosynthesis protein